MARKKSAEELAIEAELAAAGKSSIDASGKTAKTNKPEIEPEAQLAMAAAETVSDEKTHEGNVVSSEAVKKERRFNLERWKTPKGVLDALSILIVVICLVIVTYSVVRSNATDVWDGTEDTTWYKEGQTDYRFWTAEELAGLSALCEEGIDFSGVQFRLGCNIDLYDIPFKMIGSGLNEQGTVKKFAGSFNGCDHVISGINIEEDQWDWAGLFGATDKGVIENLTVEGKVVGQERVGGIVGEASGTILRNCTNRCNVSAMKTATSFYPVSADVGGVVGCWLGIMGQDAETREDSDGNVETILIPVELSNLVNEGEVSARACSAGGVIGSLNNTQDVNLTVSNIVNRGLVTVFCEGDEEDEGVGGVIGLVNSLGEIHLDGLSNTEDVSCSSVYCVGGVMGTLLHEEGGLTVANCSNSGRIGANASAEIAHVGGIAGYSAAGESAFAKCKNTGELAPTNGNSSDVVANGQADAWEQWKEANE